MVEGASPGLRQEEEAGHHRKQGEDEGVPETRIDVPEADHDGVGEEGNEAADPPGPDVVGQGHGGVAHPRREELHKAGGDRPEEGGRGDHEDEHHAEQARHVDPGGIRLGRIARGGEGGLDLGLDLGPYGLDLGRRKAGRRTGGDLGPADPDDRARARRRMLVVIRDPGVGQDAAGDVAGRDEDLLAHGIELQGAVRRVCLDHHGGARLGLGQGRVGELGQQVESGEVGDQHQGHAEQHDGLAAQPVRQGAEDHVEDRADRRDDHQDHVDGLGRDLEELVEEGLRVEEGRVPDGALGRHDRAEGQDHELQVLPLAEGLGVGRRGGAALFLQLGEGGALRELHPHEDGDQQEARREQEGDPPAPGVKGVRSEEVADDHPGQQDHEQGGEEAEGGRGLNPAGRPSAGVVRGVLGHVDRGPAVLPAQGEALQDPHQHQQGRRDQARLAVGGQEADGDRGHAHQDHREEEGALSADLVPDPAEHQGADGAEEESGAEQGEGGDVAGGLGQAREEDLRDDRGQAAEDEEVIPLEGGPGRRGPDHCPEGRVFLSRGRLAVRRGGPRLRHVYPPW